MACNSSSSQAVCVVGIHLPVRGKIQFPQQHLHCSSLQRIFIQEIKTAPSSHFLYRNSHCSHRLPWLMEFLVSLLKGEGDLGTWAKQSSLFFSSVTPFNKKTECSLSSTDSSQLKSPFAALVSSHQIMHAWVCITEPSCMQEAHTQSIKLSTCDFNV